ncbi:MAG: hypothetical protein WAO52_08020 [Prolixibacteraceae bacterium]
MRKLFQASVLFGLILSCSDQESYKHPVELTLPSAVNVSCQNTPDEILHRVEYWYEDDQLMKETTLVNGLVQSRKIFDYNLQGKLSSETYVTDWIKTEKTFIYNDLSQLINIVCKTTNYNTNGQIVDEHVEEAPLEYENNKLTKEWALWGGFSTYEYLNDKVTTKIDFTKYAEKHHVTTYTYSGDYVIEEKKETAFGTLIYDKKLQYDSDKRLISIVDGENILEENFYEGAKLIEKKTWYFGIDPGFDVCSGNYIYKYEY